MGKVSVKKSDRNEKGKFKPGNPGGPGRPKGSRNHDGLNVVLDMLKGFISDKKNILTLKNDFQVKFDKNPTRFYSSLIMPLLPKTIDIETSQVENAISRLENILSGSHKENNQENKE